MAIKLPICPFGILFMAIALAGPAVANEQPYSGQEQRAVKALSDDDIADLLAGRGWGFAKPAELNGYPGPRHILDLKNDLELTVDQIAAIEAIFAAMQSEATAIGRRYVEAERELDRLFASGEAATEMLERRAEAVERARAALRIVHLRAHIQTRPLLTHHQLARYAQLRGYSATHGHRHAH